MTRRRWAQDLALMAGALAAQLAPFVFVSPEAPGTNWTLIGYQAVLISSVPVLFRRLHPGLLLLVSTFGIALYAVAGRSTAADLVRPADLRLHGRRAEPAVAAHHRRRRNGHRHSAFGIRHSA